MRRSMTTTLHQTNIGTALENELHFEGGVGWVFWWIQFVLFFFRVLLGWLILLSFQTTCPLAGRHTLERHYVKISSDTKKFLEVYCSKGCCKTGSTKTFLVNDEGKRNIGCKGDPPAGISVPEETYPSWSHWWRTRGDPAFLNQCLLLSRVSQTDLNLKRN